MKEILRAASRIALFQRELDALNRLQADTACRQALHASLRDLLLAILTRAFQSKT